MNIQVEAVLSQNITLVYEALNLQAIGSERLKALAGAQTQPMVVDAPEMIVAIYPPHPIIVQIDDKRSRVTFPQYAETVGTAPIWDMAVGCNQLIQETGSHLSAYGFNFDLAMALAGESADNVLIRLFAHDPETISQAFDGRLVSFIPRFKFQRDDLRYDLALEPSDEQHIKVHANVHFVYENIALPEPDQLRISLCQQYQYVCTAIPRLFEE